MRVPKRQMNLSGPAKRTVKYYSGGVLSICNRYAMIAGSIMKRRLTDPRSVTRKRAKFKTKIGKRQQKTDLFDRFFRVVIGGSDGV
jgi:hypothetical protein